MDTILLTGGSGFIGHWVARLLPASFRLRVLARPTSDLSLLDRANVTYERVTGDLLDPATLRPALSGVDAVIHAAGYISFDRREAERIRQANLDASLNLFEAAQAVGTPRLVHTASIFGLGHAAQGLVTERTPFNATHLLDIPYVNAKRSLELATQRLLAEGMPLVRVYPGLCIGPEDRVHSSSRIIMDWLAGRIPTLVSGGICFIDVRDAAAALVAALFHGEVGAQYLVPGFNLTHRQFFQALTPLVSKRPPFLTVPTPLAVLGAGLMERVMARPPLTRDVVRLMGHRWWYDDTTARARLGTRYRPLAETLQATLLELQDEPPADAQAVGSVGLLG